MDVNIHQKTYKEIKEQIEPEWKVAKKIAKHSYSLFIRQFIVYHPGTALTPKICAI